jgi:hypothetical protein
MSDRSHLNRRAWTALGAPLVWLLASGCSSTGTGSASKPPEIAVVRLSATNAVPMEIDADHVAVQDMLNGHSVRLLLDHGPSP